MFLGTADTDFYQYGSRFIDDQIQLDLSSAGNTYGNDTQQFGAAWAQALSNRYLGWTAGVIQLNQVPAIIDEPRLAFSIPLATTHLFAILHFVYAFAIALLGISCLFLSKEGGPLGVVEDVTRGASVHVPDVSFAHGRLSDTSTLMHELVVRSRMGPDSALGTGTAAGGDPEKLRRTASILDPERLLDGEGRDEDGDIRVVLERKMDGGLGMAFHTG